MRAFASLTVGAALVVATAAGGGGAVAPPAAFDAVASSGDPQPRHRTVQLDGLGSVRANLLLGGGSNPNQPVIVEALGIPFARPPLGEHRFRPAAPVQAWTGTVRDATAFGPGCLQRSAAFKVAEDCLTLNIWAPVVKQSPLAMATSLAAEDDTGQEDDDDENRRDSYRDGDGSNRTSSAKPPLPPPPPRGMAVLVWAFGGGLTSGSGELYNGTNLTMAGPEPIIVVTINYRCVLMR
jgi:hypothetical protein